MLKVFIAVGLTALMSSALAQNDPTDQYIEFALQAMDKDADRQVSRSEFEVIMRGRIEAQRTTSEAGFAAADTNGDGFLDRAEAEINTQLSANFDVVDTNSDGRISKEKLGAALIAAERAEAEAAGSASQAR